MNRMKNTGLVLCGLALGLALSGPAAQAAELVSATLSNHRILVDGTEAKMEAYKVNGNNYVKLRDIGKALNINVYWDSEQGCVQIEADKPYTGEAPTKNTAPAEEAITAKADTIDTAAAKQDIIDRTNALRKEQGVAALTVNDRLTQAAQVRAEEMAASGVYAHTRPDGRSYVTVTDCKYVGENIHRLEDWALNDRNLAETMIWSWSASAGHLKNMTNNRYGSIGVGLAHGTDENGQGCWYCVQLLMDTGCTIGKVDKPAAK